MSAMYGVQSNAGDTCFLARHSRVSHAPSHAGQWSTWPQRLWGKEEQMRWPNKSIINPRGGECAGERERQQISTHHALTVALPDILLSAAVARSKNYLAFMSTGGVQHPGQRQSVSTTLPVSDRSTERETPAHCLEQVFHTTQRPRSTATNPPRCSATNAEWSLRQR